MSGEDLRDGVRHRAFAAAYTQLDRLAERGWMGAARARLLGGVRGAVLDVGAGAGANLKHFRSGAVVTAVEPTPAMRRRLAAEATRAPVPVTVRDATAEALPFGDAVFDVAVSTLVLCSVDEPDRALHEIRRVLRPGGRLLFVEHVRAAGFTGRVQDRIERVWAFAAAGCHPNRNTAAAIERAGFRFEELDTVSPRLNFPLTNPLIVGSAVA